MKKISIIVILFCLVAVSSYAQKQDNHEIPLIGARVPTFTAETTNGTLTFPDDLGSKWKILFSHPADFTPVCSSELLELASLQDEFEAMKVKLVVISTDDLAKHKSWKESLEAIDYRGKGLQKIKFPLVADANKEISRTYGMLHPASNDTKDVRGVFIVDPNNIVQAIFFYPMGVGRNIDEIKRTVLALQTANKNVVTPANWNPGDDVILSYLTEDEKSEMKQSNSDIYEVSWFMIFRKMR